MKPTWTAIGGSHTAVYGSDKQQIGSIERVMIDKISGKVAYACLEASLESETITTRFRGNRSNMTRISAVMSRALPKAS